MTSSSEHIPVIICPDHETIAKTVAQEIVAYIQAQAEKKDVAVLGLATGSTPIGVYAELIAYHRQGISFRNVVTFNLDEYYPMTPHSLQSIHRYMRENLFDHLDIPEEQIFIPRGDLSGDAVDRHCVWYEEQIAKFGGIGIQLLGIGRSGHIGINEPGSQPDARTRLIRLDETTRKDAAADFFRVEHVPREAITMGVGTILGARRIILIATGEHKAHIIKRAVEGDVSSQVAASYLQNHRNVALYLDSGAASQLTRIRTPWLVSRALEWTPELARRAVLWLCERTEKPLLHLQRRDYDNNNLYSLIDAIEDVDTINQQFFDDIRDKIREKSRLFTGKRCICFSPHPDDDVISMGGTLLQLSSVGNDLTIAYMTSGNIAVFDSDVLRLTNFIRLTFRDLGYTHDALEAVTEKIRGFFEAKRPAQIDIPEVQVLKTNIRRSEAIAGASVVGVPPEKTRFLDLPFYRTGQVKKHPIGEEDIQIIVNLLEEIRPEVVFVAGDLSDPHDTHRMCKEAIDEALKRYNPKPEIWLYRGAWQEWEVDEADVFIPLSSDDLKKKIQAIFRHESQKDTAMFPGSSDDREFWQRVQDRNIRTARRIDQLGLPQYYGMEAFVIE